MKLVIYNCVVGVTTHANLRGVATRDMSHFIASKILVYYFKFFLLYSSAGAEPGWRRARPSSLYTSIRRVSAQGKERKGKGKGESIYIAPFYILCVDITVELRDEMAIG